MRALDRRCAVGRLECDDEMFVSTATGRRRFLRGDPRHLTWWLRGQVLSTLLLGVVLVGGTLGYVIIERWSAWDAFYMTMITITTVGYDEVHDLSWAGQVFTVLLVGSGVGTALYVFSLLTAEVVEGNLAARWEARIVSRMLDNLRDHFIVCGYGRIGSIIVREFLRQGTPCVVIEADAERVRAAEEDGVPAVAADASQEEVLQRVRIDRAAGLVAAVGTDAQNVYTVLSARLLRPDLFIIARAESDDTGRKLLRAGANRVISPYRIGALQMAQTALRPAVVDFVQLATSSENLNLMMEQILIGDGSSIAGKSLVDASLRQRFGVVVVGIQRTDGHMEFNPAPDVAMHVGDRLVVLGRQESLKELEMAAR